MPATEVIGVTVVFPMNTFLGVRSAVRVIRLPHPEDPGSSHAEPASWMGSEASFSSATGGGALASWPEPIGSMRDSAAGELDTQPCAPDLPPPHSGALPRGDVTEWPVTFRADPRDYASLWARHLILTALTLGVYLPWARRHAQHFFLQHTFVAGRRFDQVESPLALALRHGLGMALALGVLAAVRGALMAGALAATVALLVWPLWLGARQQQTLSALRWGRRPLTFVATILEVYAALWPWVVAGIALVWLAWWGGEAPADASPLRLALPWGCGLVALVLLPGALWSWWRCRQQGLGIGPLRLSWRGTVGDVYRLAGRVAVWAVLCGALVLASVSLIMAAWLALAGRVPLTGQMILAAGGGMAWLALVWPYVQAASQNLVWQQTGCRYLRFRSRLSVSAYVTRRARRLITLVCTLGLAWPWVAVEARRMRLEAMTVVARVDPATLRAAWRPGRAQTPSP